MAEDNYSKREMDDHFQVVNEKLDDIKIKVEKTNGRVKALELWRSFLVGALAVIVAVVIPMITYIYFEKVDQIEHMISQVMQNYDIEVINYEQ